MKRYLIIIAMIMASASLIMAQGPVKGQITSEDGPLPGVTILEQGTSNGTITDIDGNFSFNVTTDKAVLVISYVGFETQKIPYNGATDLGVISLNFDQQALDEVVVIGYGTANKKELSSSIASVSSEDLNRMTVGNVAESLQGLASGVQVINSGGAPGGSPTILVRGVVSNSGSALPLIVVDGIPLPEGSGLNFLNPNDIQDMQILKDGSASSIYGTRASNGVILVTTKRGKSGQANVSVSGSFGLKQLEKPSLAGAEEYARVMNERQTNDGAPELWDLANLTNDTDWWEEVYKDFAAVHNYNATVSGSNEKMNYIASLGYFREESHLQKGYYERITGRFNLDYAVTDKLFIQQDFNPRYEHWENTPNVFSSVLTMDPLTPVFRPFDEREGRNIYSIYARSNNTVGNPAGAVARNFDKSYFFGLLTNTKLTYDITDKISVSSRLGLNITTTRREQFLPQFQIFPSQEERFQSEVVTRFTNRFGFVSNNLINYDDKFGKHNISATAGIVFERNQVNWVQGSNTDIILDDPKFRFIDGTNGDGQQASGTENANTLESYLARFRYNYDGKYFILGSFRRDGSSRFRGTERYANFYSASAMWTLSEEAFFSVPFINNLKVRAGFGQVGNQNIDDDASLFTVDTDVFVFGENEDRVTTNFIDQFGNPDLTWETVQDINIGIEASLFNNALNLTVDRYIKTSKRLLFETSLPDFTGIPERITRNVGSFESKGWDINVGYNKKIGELGISTNLTFNTNQSTAKRLAPGNDRLLGSRRGNFGNNFLKVTEPGGPVGLFYGYQTDGIFQNQTEVNNHSTNEGTLIQPVAQPGDLRFVDQNGDGVIDEADITTIGNPFPEFYSGLNMNFTFRNWDLNMQWYGSFGNDVYNFTKSYRVSGVSNQNVEAGLYDNVWREDNPNAKYPRLTTNDPNRNYNRSSDFFVEDGTFVRLKNLQLGYNFKVPFARTLRVYVSGQNLLTFTNYSGLDPEIAANSNSILETYGIDFAEYPLARTFLLGLNMDF